MYQDLCSVACGLLLAVGSGVANVKEAIARSLETQQCSSTITVYNLGLTLPDLRHYALIEDLKNLIPECCLLVGRFLLSQLRNLWFR